MEKAKRFSFLPKVTLEVKQWVSYGENTCHHFHQVAMILICQDFKWLCLMKPSSFWSVLPATTFYLQMSVFLGAEQSTVNKAYFLLLREDLSVAPFEKINWRIFFHYKVWSYWAKRRREGKNRHHIICIPHWLTSQMISYSFKSSLHCTKRGNLAGD